MYRFQVILVLFTLFISNSCSFETGDLENIMMNLRQDKKLTAKQSITLQSLYKIYAKNPKNLSVLEDNIVFLSMQKINKESKKVASSFKPEWQLYSRLDRNGYSLAIEEFSKNGDIHELSSLQKNDELPYVKWSNDKLDLVYVKGVDPVRSIMSYSVASSRSFAVVDSSNDDYSPIYGPNSQTVLFLSDRDKTHSRDKRVGVYVVFLDEVEHVYKLTKLSLIQPNYNFKQPRFYITDEHIIYYDENGKQFIPLSKLGNIKKMGPSKNKLKNSVLKKVVTKQLNKNKTQESDEIQSTKWQEHEIKIQSKGNKLFLKIQFPYEFKYNILSEMTIDAFENVWGSIFVTNKKYMFFVTNNKGRSQINYIKRGSKKINILSDKRENCHSMFLDSSENTLYYILERSNRHFVVEYSLTSLKVVSRKAIQSVLKLPGLSPLFKENGQIMYFNAAGVSHLLHGEKVIIKNNVKMPPEVYKRSKKKHLFSLESDTPVVKAEKDKKYEVKLNIDDELKHLVQKIRKITTIQDLNQLKYRYSVVHSRVSTLSKDQKFVQNSSKKIKLIRWIELLNGIKVLLNQASILMEEE
ncbi:MAG: hypothetical protein KC646_11595 [Candidatus Cloacimonetes bacterium]|nr:hypothetical protein [Candidatus Cloacimonadota bacterium]